MYLFPQSNKIQLKYKIISEDEPIGFALSEIEIEKSGDQPVVKKDSIINTSSSGFLKNDEITEVENILFKKNKIIEYSGISSENEKYSSVSMQNVADLFIIDSEYGKKKSINLLELSAFDCTSEELVGLFLSSNKKASTYQIFDLSRFDIEQVEVSLKEPETIYALNEQWPCQVVSIKNLSQPIITNKWVFSLGNQFLIFKETEIESDNETLIVLDFFKTDIDYK
jgi:hypothetical protein